MFDGGYDGSIIKSVYHIMKILLWRKLETCVIGEELEDIGLFILGLCEERLPDSLGPQVWVLGRVHDLNDLARLVELLLRKDEIDC